MTVEKIKAQVRLQIRPLFFSKPVQRVVAQGNRLASRFLFAPQAKQRLRALLARLPIEFSTPALANLDALFEACLRGRGVGPFSYFEMARWLGGGAESLLASSAIPSVRATPSTPTRSTSKKARKLKILFVSAAYPSEFHGGGLMLLDLIELLAAEHEVSLYCLHNETQDGTPDFAKLKSVKALKIITGGANFVDGFESWVSARAFESYDAIHFLWPESAELMTQARPYGRRLVFQFVECCTRRDAISLVRETQSPPPLLARNLYNLMVSFRLEALASSLADETISVIGQDAEFVAHVFKRELGKTIPACLSEEHLWQRLDPNTAAPLNQDALFLGFFGHTPNIESLQWYLTEVHARVCRRLPDYRLIISGRGAGEKIAAMIKDVPQVEYRGTFDDLVTEIASVRIGLAPLVSGSGIRTKVNQYSAVGRPTVTTSIGALGLPYVANESILLADSPGEFAERVIRLLEDKTLYESMRFKARELAEKNFRWKAYLRELESIYVG